MSQGIEGREGRLVSNGPRASVAPSSPPVKFANHNCSRDIFYRFKNSKTKVVIWRFRRSTARSRCEPSAECHRRKVSLEPLTSAPARHSANGTLA